MLVSVPKLVAVRLELLRREVNAGRRFSHGFLNLRTLDCVLHSHG